MRNIFYKAVPGLFRRKKIVESDNQSFYYNNTVMESLNNLEVTNKKLVNNLTGLSKSTNQIGERTKELSEAISMVEHMQAEELDKVADQINMLTDRQVEEMNELREHFQNLQQKHQERLGNQIGELEISLRRLKSDHDVNHINVKNDHEILTVSLERLYQRLEDIKDKQVEEIKKVSEKIDETQQELAEQSDIHMNNNKLNADLLYKLREHYFEYENISIKEHERLEGLMMDLHNEVIRIKEMMAADNSLIK
ncbi:hypothetical protein [Evansella tamaricis]|uniref:Uncharacterized protein n=1 Tax=Evansella tamaricis TaxID=2069301 RepID=A0ABS6JHG2_9BACI|nr:hypothetical protein [Evansella tamaricis]MBU9713110.1 hypothetical protein [Evansella tamaricis]